ncbi:hypothetical protein RKD26_002554 [Streptomyces calvus]
MRRTDRPVRRGTSLRTSDRTAGDSSPVTQNGRLRGRPEPAGRNTAGAGRTDRPAALPPGAAPRHRRFPDVGADERRAPRLSPRGPSPATTHLPAAPTRDGHRLAGRAPRRMATASPDGRRPAGGHRPAGRAPRGMATASPDGHHLAGQTLSRRTGRCLTGRPPSRQTGTVPPDGHLAGWPPPRRTDAVPPDGPLPYRTATVSSDGHRPAGRPGLPDGHSLPGGQGPPGGAVFRGGSRLRTRRRPGHR